MTNNNPRIIRLAPKTQCYLDVRYDGHHSKFDVVDQRFDYPAVVPVTFPAAWAYWKLDEASGTRVDATGNGHDLDTISGNISSVSGLLGNCLIIQKGPDPYGYSYIKRATAGLDLTGNKAFTLAMWLKLHWVGAYGNWMIEPLHIFSGTDRIALEITTSYESGKITEYYPYCDGSGDTSTTELTPAPEWNPEEWNLYVFRYSGSDFKVCVNNELLITDPSYPSYLNGVLSDIVLGMDDGSFSTFNAELHITHTGIWVGENVPTDEQMTQFYNGGAGWSPY